MRGLMMAVSGLVLALGTMATSMAATITVTTAKDELNCNSASCGNNANAPSQGCSLREAMFNVAAGNNTSYPECAAPTAGGPNTIELNGLDIQINGAVDDPNQPGGMPQVHNGSLENDANVVDAASQGALTVQNGMLSCFTDGTTHVGAKMFHVNTGGDLTLSKLSLHDCEDNELGIAVRTNSGTGSNNNSTSLTINNTTFTNIHSTDGSSGGCINHGDGNLTINDSAFTNCRIDDSQQTSGAHDAAGGAIAIGSVGSGTLAQIYNTAFTTNTAKTNGGAIALDGTDSIIMVNLAFTGNKANGNTFDSGNAERGGGAIYASNTEQGNQLTSTFLIINSVFTGNSAPDGTGGAILLSGGNLTYGASLAQAPGAIGVPNGAPATTPPYPTNVPGGIFSTNFLSNSAGGKWNGMPVDTRAGAGGAIFARGNLAILDASFISNSSSNGSGGGIAQYGTSSVSTLSAANVTLNGNSANVNGGAIANLRNSADSFNATMMLTNDTLSGNSAGSNGGALFNGGAQADVVVANSILASSSAGGNCAGPNGITDQTHNLQFGSGTDCGAAMTVGDPLLSAPAPFGGVNFQVAVMQINTGSAASGNGDPATCTAQPIYNLDAALNARPNGATNCDIGAFEAGIAATEPDLTITKSHTDPFISPSTGHDYTITVGNAGTGASSGMVTVVDTLPAGLTATNITGTGWNCTLATLTCTRSDALATAAQFPPITLTVDVASGLNGNVINSASVSGGGESNTANDSVDDPTTLSPPADLTIDMSHAGNFAKGQAGAIFTITASNIGAGPTSGLVTVADNLPAGLTATAMAGVGWTCTLGTLTCTRSDGLGNASAYPPITLTVDVAANPPAQVVNSADVSGGGEIDTSNNHVDDPTTLPVTLQSFEVD